MKIGCFLLLVCLVGGICAQVLGQQGAGGRGAGASVGTGRASSAGVGGSGGLFGSRTGNLFAAGGYFGDQMERYGMCSILFPNNPNMCIFSLFGGGLFNR